MHEYRFFLSYARSDIDDNLRKFYSDLSEEVRKLAMLPPQTRNQEIGFLDEEGIEVGEEWPASIAAALQSTRTLVCLYSSGYFTRPYCGKEFEVFRRRTEGIPGASSLIMPVLWREPEDLPRPLPSPLAAIQYSNAAFGDIYAKLGLYSIMHSSLHDNDYRLFVLEFARQLEAHAKRVAARPLKQLPPLSQISNPFKTPAIEFGSSRRQSDGRSIVQFYFFAGKKNDMKDIKIETEAYGEERERDWRPFFPQTQDSAARISQRVVATQTNLVAEMYPVEKDLTDQLSRAEDENTVVCLLIDPWTVQLEFYRNRLNDYDAKRPINCGALVVWNEQDRELPSRSLVLKQHVEAALSRIIALKDPIFRDSIRSVEDLRKEIRATIFKIQERLIKRANILRPISGTGARPPSISGSGGIPHE
jgi:FxsC-like protein